MNSFPGFVAHEYRLISAASSRFHLFPPTRTGLSGDVWRQNWKSSTSDSTACVQTFPRSHRKLRNRQSSVM
jgi:hypothetical protein